MADIHYSGAHGPASENDYSPDETPDAAEAGRVAQLINWAGAVMSIGLVVGMGIWAWQLLMRDVTDVPVIRAMEGPMRVAPENPGGSVAENQGLAVNRLAEGEEAAPVPDQLTLAPPPVDLAEVPEEIEQAFESASVASDLPEDTPVVEAEIAPDVAADMDAEPIAPPAAQDTEALIERLLAEAQPLEPLDDTAAADVAQPQAGQTFEVIPASVPGVSRSLRPTLRPAAIRTRAEAATVVTTGSSVADNPIAADELELAAAELEAGTRLVQLGAFDTRDLARAEWDRLAQLYPDFFIARARVIEEATSGGQTFYRLRAHGFDDLSASRRFCAALVAQGAACIPVTVR